MKKRRIIPITEIAPKALYSRKSFAGPAIRQYEMTELDLFIRKLKLIVSHSDTQTVRFFMEKPREYTLRSFFDRRYTTVRNNIPQTMEQYFQMTNWDAPRPYCATIWVPRKTIYSMFEITESDLVYMKMTNLGLDKFLKSLELRISA